MWDPKIANNELGFSRRAFALITFKLALLTGLMGRLYHMQISNSGDYELRSKNNSIKVNIIL